MEALPLRAGGEMDAIIDRYQDTVYGLALAIGPTPTMYFRRYSWPTANAEKPSGTRSTERPGCCAPPSTSPGG